MSHGHHGLDLDLVTQFAKNVQAAGGTDEFWHSGAKSNKLARKLVKFANRAKEMRSVFHLEPGFNQDKRNEWKLFTDSPKEWGDFKPKFVELSPEFLKLCEAVDSGHMEKDELLKRITKLRHCLGQRHGDAMLKNRHRMPADVLHFKLLLPRTIWGGKNGHYYWAFLSLDGPHWHMNFIRIGKICDPNNWRVVVCPPRK